MNIGADLIRAPQLRKLAELADGINDETQTIVDGLAEYEDAEDAEEREDIREDVAQAVGDLLSVADQLREYAKRLEAS